MTAAPGRFFNRKDVAHSAELQRVLALPRRTWSPADLEKLAADMTRVLRRERGTMTLRPIQALALYEIGTQGGLFGPIRVGGGKTLTSLLAAYVLESRRAILLLPASLVAKTQRAVEALSQHWRIDGSVRIVSYEMLGRVNGARILETWEPNLIIADEAHRLKNKRAGVTRRVTRWMREHPDTRFIAISGTMMTHGLRDFAHLLRWSLKGNAPIPHNEGEIDEWADALDEGGRLNPLQRIAPGALLTLATPEERRDLDEVTAARRGFRRRLTETPGVVATGGEQVACSLYVSALEYDVSSTTEANFQKLRDTWTTPDDWDIAEAIEKWACARQLALGFHYVQVSEEGWRKCLSWVKQNGNLIAPTGSATSNAFGSTIASGQSGAAREKSGSTCSRVGTGSRPSNTKPSTRKAEGVVTFAEKPVSSTDSASTTITRLDESEGFSAFLAIARSGSSEIQRNPSLAPFNTLLAEARPPQEWRDARRAWKKFVRDVLSRPQRRDDPLDTELQVALACRRGDLSREEFDEWVRVEPSFTPRSKAVWHDDSALRACQAWMTEHPGGGIVWTEHDFFAEELSRRTGALYFGAKGLDRRGLDLTVFAEERKVGPTIIASIAANATGRDLQHRWSRNLVTTSLGAAAWEQLLGRTHRDGQEADEITVDVLMACHEHFDGWQKAIAGARAAEDTLGGAQKLLLADLDMPGESDIARRPGARWSKNGG